MLQSARTPLTADVKRGQVAVVGFTDLDGTANNEELPERDRLHSVGPADGVITELQSRGIPTGIITGRSLGEALVYAKALKSQGPIICEDGAVIVLPKVFSPDAPGFPKPLAQKLVNHRDRWIISLSSVSTGKLNDVVNFANKQLLTQQPAHPKMIGSSQLANIYALTDLAQIETAILNSTDFQLVKRWIGYDSDDALIAAAHRLATCFVATENFATFDQTGQNDLQRDCLLYAAAHFDLEVFSPRLPHIREKGIDKALALSMIDKYAPHLLGGSCQGILPICFGNNDNDVKMMRGIGKYQGIGVVVGHPDRQKGHYIKASDVACEHVFVANQPYGLGMREGLPFIYKRLRALGLNF